MAEYWPSWVYGPSHSKIGQLHLVTTTTIPLFEYYNLQWRGGGRTFWTFDRGLVKLEGPAQNYGPCGGAESTAETQSLYYSPEQNDCAWSEKAAILSRSLSACNLPYLLANKGLQQWALQTDRAESEDMGTVWRETISIANVALRWTPQGKREAFPTPTGEGLHRQNFRPQTLTGSRDRGTLLMPYATVDI